MISAEHAEKLKLPLDSSVEDAGRRCHQLLLQRRQQLGRLTPSHPDRPAMETSITDLEIVLSDLLEAARKRLADVEEGLEKLHPQNPLLLRHKRDRDRLAPFVAQMTQWVFEPVIFELCYQAEAALEETPPKKSKARQLLQQAREVGRELNDEAEPMQLLRELEARLRAEVPPSSHIQQSRPPSTPAPASTPSQSPPPPSAELHAETAAGTTRSGAFRSGQKLANGRFILIQPLGRGGMSEVWLAQDERLREPVALKFLPPDIRQDPVALDDLRRETASSHALAHPNIVRIHDLHEEPSGLAFIAMECVSGPTLASLRVQQPQRVLGWTYLRPLLDQLCGALDYAHGEKVIHRDLKPANMMVDARGRLKLADFGIAAVASDSVSRVSRRHATSGTLPYMSPQQLAGHRPQVTDDIYALGVTLYELLTSKPPFYIGDVTHQALHNPPEPLHERLAALEIENSIPPDVADLVLDCLAKEPGRRPQTARAVAQRIGMSMPAHLAISQTPISIPATPPAPAPAAIPAESVDTAPTPPPSLSSRSAPPVEDAAAAALTELTPSPPLELPPEPLLSPPLLELPAPEPPPPLELAPPPEAPPPIPEQTVVALPPPPPPPPIPAATVPEPPPPPPSGPSPHPAEAKPAPAKPWKSRPVRAAAVLAVLVLLFGVYWIFFRPRGGVAITTEPSGATLTLAGRKPQPSPFTFTRLNPGAYHVAIHLDGYEPIDGKVEIKGTNISSLNFPLARSTGKVHFLNLPPGTAYKIRQIKSDIGAAEWKPQSGVAATNLASLPSGSYEVILQTFGWPDVITQVTVQPDGDAAVEHHFGGGTLSLSADPDTAEILIDGRTNFQRPVLAELPPGSHQIEVRNPVAGYEPVVLPVELAASQSTNLGTIKLPRSAGTLRLASTPPGANFQVEQVRSQVSAANEWTPQTGVTPATLDAVPTGTYNVALQLAGWPGFTNEVLVENGNTAAVEYEFTGGTAAVSTEPAGAILSVDGRTCGAAPANLPLLPGSHQLVARLAGYDPVTRQIEIANHDSINLGNIKLSRSAGLLQVKSIPAALKFQVQQTSSEAGLSSEWPSQSGLTPVTLDNLPSGTYQAILQRPGWPDFVQEVAVEKGTPAVVEHLFVGGTIAVSTKPAGAAIWVDDKPFGSSPANLDANIGFHEVRAQFRDWSDAQQTQSLLLEKDQTNQVQFVLGGSVLITSDPTNATVEDSTGELGRTPLQLTDIKPGAVTYRLQSRSYIDARLSGTVIAGQQLPLDVQLQRAFPTMNGLWTNSLGMIFTPITGTNMLFSIWDTRVADYQAFARDTARKWDTQAADLHPDDPAIMVSWNDARAFCAWLTKKDQQAALLLTNQLIRLPYDAEWSLAVGLGRETGATPAEKSGKIKNLYPWGRQWLPPPNSGNFRDESYGQQPYLTGFHDGYVEWSPVGHFDPTGDASYELYDMAGNVQQWCLDWYDANREQHVLRGGSWNTYLADELLSSHRAADAPADRNFEIGFRCVVELLAPPPFPSWVDRFRAPLRVTDDDDWQTIGNCIQQIGLPAATPAGSAAKTLRRESEKDTGDQIVEDLRRYRNAVGFISSDNTALQETLLNLLTPPQQATAVLEGLVK